MTACTSCLPNRAKAEASSPPVAASSVSTAMPRARAATSTLWAKSRIDAPLGLDRNPMRRAPGMTSSATSTSLTVIPSRPRIAREEMRDARIGEREADDRQHRRDPFERDGGAGRVGHQDVRLERDQFLRQRLKLFDVAVTIVDIQVATFRVAQAAQAVDEGEVQALLRPQHQERDAGAGVGRAAPSSDMNSRRLKSNMRPSSQGGQRP